MTKDATPRQHWYLIMPSSLSQDTKIMPKILTKTKHHKIPEKTCLISPVVGSEDAKIMHKKDSLKQPSLNIIDACVTP